MGMEHWWTNINRSKLKCLEKMLHHCFFVITNPTWTAMELSPGIHGDRLETSCSCHGITVLFYVLFVCNCVLYYCHRVCSKSQLTNISIHTGLFISPSGISELDCATTKTDTAERSRAYQ